MKMENRVKYVYEHKEVYFMALQLCRSSKTFASFFAQRIQADSKVFKLKLDCSNSTMLHAIWWENNEKLYFKIYFFSTENLSITLFSLNFLNFISKYILSFSCMPGIITLAARDKEKKIRCCLFFSRSSFKGMLTNPL